MKRAFFSELEKKHGGPISVEELRLWSNALDEDDTDVEIAPVVEAAYSSAASARASREGSTRASLEFVDALSSPEGSTRASAFCRWSSARSSASGSNAVARMRADGSAVRSAEV